MNTKLTIKNLKVQIVQIKTNMFIRFALVVATFAKIKIKSLKFNILSKHKNKNKNEHIR